MCLHIFAVCCSLPSRHHHLSPCPLYALSHIIGRPPVPPPPPAPRAGHTPPSPGPWLCAKCRLCATTIPARHLSSDPKHLITVLCKRLLVKPHYRFVAISQKKSVFFNAPLFFKCPSIGRACDYKCFHRMEKEARSCSAFALDGIM